VPRRDRIPNGGERAFDWRRRRLEPTTDTIPDSAVVADTAEGPAHVFFWPGSHTRDQCVTVPLAMPTHTPHHQIPILTTFEAPPGTEIATVLGPAGASRAFAERHRHRLCGCQQIFGGEISALTELAIESRNEAMHRLEQQAIGMGAMRCWRCVSIRGS